MKVLMCVPNISEGKNESLIDAIAGAVRSVEGIKLLEVSSDRDHHRSVFSYLGEPEKVLEATKKLADLAVDGIDMSGHRGDHPRMGALDVAPFIPVRNMTTAEAVVIARSFGSYLGSKGIPVYYYEDAATSAERKNLADVRKGQYEALAGKLKDPAWAPDAGPAVFNASAGATAVGVRFPLVAFNVNLNTTDISIADRIARGVRHLSGGYRFVRAIGVTLSEKGMVQVSMNLTNYTKTPIHRVMETIRFEASRYGVAIASAELVGPVPLEALEEVVRFYLQIDNFSVGQIIESNLLE
jgi:glutamate formiminotransferase / 5-formyltetrahydrofolate cyclo-ligase